MDPLNPKNVKHIVWHTAAHGSGITCHKTTVADIDKWHREERGWPMIGYHYVVYNDATGSVHKGRPIEKVGAQVAGINSKSVGICFSGHGDICALTPEQIESGVELTIELLDKFGLRDDFLTGQNLGLTVMGHREVNALVAAGMAPTKTGKSCPGTKVDMNAMRLLIRQKLGAPVASDPDFVFEDDAAKSFLASLRGLYAAAAELKLNDDSLRHLNAFRKDDAVDRLIEKTKKIPVG
jgi:hypothetical protein